MNQSDKNNPNTVDQVVNEIIEELTLEERVGAANLEENELRALKLMLGKYLRYRLDQLDVGVNKMLMKDCLEKSGESLNKAEAATVILRELWKRLRETHKLRVVK
jgi:hypothetical protein